MKFLSSQEQTSAVLVVGMAGEGASGTEGGRVGGGVMECHGYAGLPGGGATSQEGQV